MDAYGPESLLKLGDRLVGCGVHGIAALVLALEAHDSADELEVAGLAGVAFVAVVRYREALLIVAKVDLFGGVGRWVRVEAPWVDELDSSPVRMWLL